MKITKLIKLFIIIIIITVFATTMCFMSFGRGWIDDDGEWKYMADDGMPVTDTIKASGDDKYYLNQNGIMVRDYLLEDYNDGIYYFDDNGKMVKNTWVAVDPMQVQNQMDNPPTIYLYYFGANGKAYKAVNNIIRRTIDGKKYLFNEYGQMLSGWINEQGERYDENDTENDPFMGFCYYAGDETDGVLREGWHGWEEGSVQDHYYTKETLWFYFKPNDCIKFQSNSPSTMLKKKINGHTYAFDENGVMIQGWDSDMISIATTSNYFSELKNDERGRMHKKEWIFAVPSARQSLGENTDDHDSEVERWFYSLGGGDIVKNEMKKINTNYYVFDEKGIMKKGLCVIESGTNRYVDCIDTEKTDGRDFIISRHYVSVDKYSPANEFCVFDDKKQKLFFFEMDEESEVFGKRKLGKTYVPFGDDDYEFYSASGSGEYEGFKNKKYYQNGILLKADEALGLGLVFIGYSTNSNATMPTYSPSYYDDADSHPYARIDHNHKKIIGDVPTDVKSDYIVISSLKDCEIEKVYPVYKVIDSNGNKINKSFYVKKDKSNHYWMLGDNQSFIQCFEVQIKYNKTVNKWQFKSETPDTRTGKSKTAWINFGDTDIYGKTCYEYRTGEGSSKAPGGYEVSLDETYCINFRFEDPVS